MMAAKSVEKRWYKQWWVIVLFVAMFLVLCFAILVVVATVVVVLYGAGSGPTTGPTPVDPSLKTSDFMQGSPPGAPGFMGITTVVKECGFSNAFYSGKTREITMCEELAYDLAVSFYPEIERSYGNDSDALDRKLREKVYSTLTFVYGHERGHALIDVFRLPITGREEDVADQFAFYYALSDQQDVIVDASIWYLVRSQQGDPNDLPFYDEHSFDKQRYYNLLCWLYGADTEKYAYVVDDGFLPKERAQRCPYESYQVSQGIENLLAQMQEQTDALAADS